MFAVHARYGLKNWADLLRPAEALARDGHPVSRAHARSLNAVMASLRAHPDTARLLGVDDGEIAEGTPLRQIELATMLTAIRIRGAGDFYQGASARQFVDAVQQAGGTLTLADLRGYLPRLQAPLEAPLGNDVIYFSGAGGIVAGRVWSMLHDDDRYLEARDAGPRAHLLAAASARAYAAGRHDSGPVSISPEAGAALIAGFDPARRDPQGAAASAGYDSDATASQNGASLVVVDRFGQVVACGYTMGRPFGSGVLAPGTGILLAPADAGAGVSRPAAVVLVNTVNAQTFFGAAISGGSPVGLAPLPLDVPAGEMPLDRALALPRLYDPARPDLVIYEKSWDAAAVDRLRQLGYRLVAADKLGLVNAFHCPDGLPRRPACQFLQDPRGYGLAASADAN